MMKLQHLATLFMGLALATTSHAQGKYGATPADSLECVKNFSMYQEFVRQGSYEDAYLPWQEVLKVCPAVSKGVYQNGGTILKNLIAKEKDPARKTRLIDSLYLVYDMRVTHFGEEAFVLGRKGTDMLSYAPEKCQEAFEVLKASIAAGGPRSEPGTLSNYYQALNCLYTAGKATKEQMLTDYVMVMGHIDANLANEALKEDLRTDYGKARDYVNGLFFKVAECADIGRIVETMLAEKPDDQDLKVRLLRVLNGKDCTEEKVYRSLAEDVHKANPSAESAYSLGMYLVKRNEMGSASKYLKEAVDLCDGCADKVKYLLKAGQVSSAAGNHGLARSYANQMLQIDPKNGEALIIIGDAISAQAGACEKPDSWGAYWLAYDYYQRAKSLDPGAAEKAGDRASRAYAHFPTQSDAFFFQLTDGQSIQVACGGLNESTTVRTRK